ncbi:MULTISPECIES: Gfo/Idh/MocA family oxidoreductase [Micrococcaceae]|uniref:Gfo/Idh/MocA family protein n=1 Tax=Micrococcaceae TaxID=1268 RepID=UPI001035D654|nr:MULTISPECIES: Gfo/Idh/MocA family oxidoreductase [Micrococcaceae]TAP27075.1 Gfo/Idh/MocA family oxidoreductase [Arthrobacter sp. S41]UXN31303.1 Gfo/Idh/MocA family oxidoreductase [Glutamicibacter sp. M10]
MSVAPETLVHPALRVAVIGAGYWGPNLARNFAMSTDWELVAICDMDLDRAEALARKTGNPAVVSSLDELLARHQIDAVAIATPARTHHQIAMQAIAAGKHVVVEKPLADNSVHGAQMVEAAAAAGTILMADHTYCYTPAVLKIRDLLADNELGEILYIDSTRINLGLVQPDVDVFWDLAPHDLSILDFVLPGGLSARTVTALGSDPLHAGKSCVGYLSMELESGILAHINVNWLSPTKIRRMVIGGSRKTLVWDDLNPQQRLTIFDRGVDLERQEMMRADAEDRKGATISYRLGDTWSPALSEFEPLGLMVSEFAASIRGARPAPTDGPSALRVLKVLEHADRSRAAAAATLSTDHSTAAMENAR